MQVDGGGRIASPVAESAVLHETCAVFNPSTLRAVLKQSAGDNQFPTSVLGAILNDPHSDKVKARETSYKRKHALAECIGETNACKTCNTHRYTTITSHRPAQVEKR